MSLADATMKGAATGSALGPWGAAAGGLIGAGASLFGGAQAAAALQRARAAYGEKAQQGINQLQAGRGEAKSNYAPLIAGGQNSYQQAQDWTTGRTQADQPQYTAMDANSADPYMAKMSDYGQRQSQQAMQASALARGGMGGGFLKALSNNAQDYAATKYGQAQQMAQGANAQNFGQQQTIYGNKTAYDQSQIDNAARNASTGIGALGNYSGIAQGYDNGINGAYENWGTSLANLYGSQAANANATAATMGSGLSGAAAGIIDTFAKKYGLPGTKYQPTEAEAGQRAENQYASRG